MLSSSSLFSIARFLLPRLWQDCGNIVVIVGHRMGWSPFPGTTVDRVSPVLTRERVVYHP